MSEEEIVEHTAEKSAERRPRERSGDGLAVQLEEPGRRPSVTEDSVRKEEVRETGLWVWAGPAGHLGPSDLTQSSELHCKQFHHPSPRGCFFLCTHSNFPASLKEDNKLKRRSF